MKNRTKDSDLPIGKLTKVDDFLPPPEKLIVPKGGKIQVTMYLSKNSVNFFKRKAKQHHTKYQKMIRELIDRYVWANEML